MPYKNYQDKLDYNHNFVKHYRDNEKGFEQINLNGIKKRLYVCEFCTEISKTQFHELSYNNSFNVIELCKYCHDLIRLQKFNENKLFGE